MGSQFNVYKIFGFLVASDYDFSFVTTVNSNKKDSNERSSYDLYFSCVEGSPENILVNSIHPVYINYSLANSNKILISLYQLDSCYLIRFVDFADYYVYNKKILCYLHNPEKKGLVEISLLGPVLSIWIERRGILAIHASGVKTQHGTVAFLGNNKGGKSGLAASFIQSGNSLITDDVLAIDCSTNQVLVRPSYPVMRMWPDEAEHFFNGYENLPFVHPSYNKRKILIEKTGFGTFEAAPQKLKCIYIPTRCFNGNKDISIEAISSSEALIDLIRYSFTPRILSAIGMETKRLFTLATIVKSVPFRRIFYPNGFTYLPVVCKAILKDLESVISSN